jgi:2'-5' RNA ligase
MEMYFIAIVAPEEIDKDVSKWKHYMRDRFGCTVALKSPAHVTLTPPFWMDPALENDLIKTIEQFSLTQKDFPLQVHNFDAFAPRVIFAAIEKNAALDELQRSFNDVLLAAGKFPVKRDDRPYHPHITIANRDLYKKAFKEAWEIFSTKKYEASWQVQDISLLRHNKKNWDVVYTSQFK